MSKVGVPRFFDGIYSLAQLAQLLQPYFAPASILTPPAAQGTTGGRVVALTTNKKFPAPLSIQVATAALVGGIYTWKYPLKFNSAPVVFAFPVNPDAGKNLFLSGLPNATQATIQSDDPADTRTIQLLAVGNTS